jgi:hypothetical protein
MGTKTLATLRQRVSEAIGDWQQSTVTTALTTSTAVVDTGLADYTSRDNYFIRRWCLVTSQANAGENRKISDYVASTKTLTVLGANFADDGANLATYEIHSYNPDNITRAINEAARELYGKLFRRVERDDTLVLGSHLPDGHFENWSSATALTFYTETSNATLARTTTAANIRGGKYSAKLTAGAADSYFAVNSDIYPRLLNLQGQTIDFHCWVYPEVANDAEIVIYTKTTAGTEATTTSTTTNAAGNWSRISIENHAVPDDLSKIEFRFQVQTNTKYVYFDKARVVGPNVYEYVLPPDFQLGHISSVYEQTGGEAEDMCDDLYTSVASTRRVFNYDTFYQEGYNYIRLNYISNQERKLILSGYAPLEDTLSAETDTMTIDDPFTDLLVARAAYRLFEHEIGTHSSEDTTHLRNLAAYWYGKSEELKRSIGMVKPQSFVRLAR